MSITQMERHTDLVQRSGQVIDRGGALSARELQSRVEVILEVMANVLEEGKDYGRIPGTDKPTLYKPGAEMLCLTFRLAAAEPKTEDLSTDEAVRYRTAVPIEGPDGRVLAVGIGEASTNEEKYRWRKPVCEEEWQEMEPHLRREKWTKKDNRTFKIKQIRTSPADLANTALKMAHKRAFIHGTLLATGASRVFNQDLEDFEKELRDSLIDADETTRAETKQPQRKSQTGTTQKAEPAAIPVDAKVVVGLVEKVGRPKDKKYFAIKLKGDSRTFTAWIDKFEQLEKDATAFVDTDHRVKLAYLEVEDKGKTYCNAVGIAIADAEPTKPHASEQATLPVTADDIFSSNREPGSEG